MIKQYDCLYKVIIVGNSSVGKSSILVRFADGQFEENYSATIGVDFRFKSAVVNGKNVKFQIWDTTGQERFRTITNAYYRGRQAVLMVFDITDSTSFNDLTKFWMREIELYAEKDALLVLIGNKSDMADHRKVPMDEVKSFCNSNKMIYVQCSAKDNSNIKDIFVQIAQALMKRKSLKKLPSGQAKKGQGLLRDPDKKGKQKCC